MFSVRKSWLLRPLGVVLTSAKAGLKRPPSVALYVMCGLSYPHFGLVRMD